MSRPILSFNVNGSLALAHVAAADIIQHSQTYQHALVDQYSDADGKVILDDSGNPLRVPFLKNQLRYFDLCLTLTKSRRNCLLS